MKKRKLFTRIIAIVLCVLMVAGIVAGAASAAKFPDDGASNTKDSRSKTFDVRVNGDLVEFPDEQPFVDANNRTLVPIRFIMEALGADVYWNQYDKIVEVYKDGITVKVKVGEKDILVEDNGYYNYWTGGYRRSVITMDTVAVAKNGRVFVPIRFIGEALGAHVDWASAFNTVTVFCDGDLMAKEIRELRQFPYTSVKDYTSYAKAKQMYATKPERLDYHYGTLRDTFTSFANAQEYLYEIDALRSNYNHYYGDVGNELYVQSGEDFYDVVVEQAKEDLNYDSWTTNITVRADTSCLYHPDTANGEATVVRGYITYHVTDDYYYGYYYGELPEEDRDALDCALGEKFKVIADGEEHTVAVDIHVRTSVGEPIEIIDVIVLE